MLTATQRIRIEWAHCDPAGMVFDPRYCIWTDCATRALLRATGLDYYRRLRDPLRRPRRTRARSTPRRETPAPQKPIE